VVFDVTTVIVPGRHELRPHKTANLTDKNCVYSYFSTDRQFPSLSPSPRPPYSLRHNNIEIRPINNPTMASNCSSERKSRTSFTLNEKLQMIMLVEEGMSKAKQSAKL
jgi:hypothetical protein